MKAIARLVLFAPLLAAACLADTTERTARVVRYHANDIVSIRAKLRYTTMIQLPEGEKVVQAATGDKDYWIVDAVLNYCFLHPARPSTHSNLNLITDKGNVYSFTLDEVETSDPDLKVVIEPSDPAMITAVSGSRKFVPEAEIETFKSAAQSEERRMSERVSEFKSDYPTRELKFDYAYRNRGPFRVLAIYHDNQFTYVKSVAREKFAIYEVKDGKPNYINFDLRDGTYVIAKVVDRGYLQIGRKRLSFARQQP
jgi:type IV secretion system protein VirB9